MNKAYLLVICLLATTLTGCIGDQQPLYDDGTEKETIEPVGTHNNETSEYDILIGEIQNLTDEIEELKANLARAKEDHQYDNLVHQNELESLRKK